MIRVADPALLGAGDPPVWPICPGCGRAIRELPVVLKYHRACRLAMKATNTMPPRDRGRADLSAAEIERRMAEADAQQKAARKRV